MPRRLSTCLISTLRCRKFEEGLKYEIKRTVIQMAIRIFPNLVGTAKVVECLETGNRVMRTDGVRSSRSKKGYSHKKPYDHPSGQQAVV